MVETQPAQAPETQEAVKDSGTNGNPKADAVPSPSKTAEANAFKSEIRQSREPGFWSWLKSKNEITRLTFSQLVAESAGWGVAALGSVAFAKLQDSKNSSIAGFMQRIANPVNDFLQWRGPYKWLQPNRWLNGLANRMPVVGKALAGKNQDWTTLSGTEKTDHASKQIVALGGANLAAFAVNSWVQWVVDKKLKVQQDSLKETIGLKFLTDEIPKVLTFLLSNTALKKPLGWVQNRLKEQMGKDSHAVNNFVDTVVLAGPMEVVGTVTNIAALHYNRKRKMADKIRQEKENSAKAVPLR